jgi:large subunit ribosomal protein L10
MANAKIMEKKKRVVDELKQKIEAARVLIISDYRGVTVKQITELRSKLYSQESEFRIIKNTLLRRAFEKAGLEKLNEHLEGPIGVLLGYQDPMEPLKSLVDFMDEVEKGEIKGGVVEKTIIDQKTITDMAKLPPREVLLARVAGGLNAPIYGLVNVLRGNIRKLVYALNAVREKKEQ